MKDIKLLDCTVRDGGYLNDWNFGQSVLTETVQRSINAGVEYIELGFLDDRRNFDVNRSIFPSTQCLNEIYKGIKKSNSVKFVAMIDYGTCALMNIQRQEDTILDGIRVIFKKEKMIPALEYCAEIKKLGYEVFTQLVSATVYSDADFDRLIAIENELKPAAVSIVDTYGLMDSTELERIFKKLDSNLAQEIMLGFHAHNNLQLGFSNAFGFLMNEVGRPILADGTLLGMGKGAGNCPIELLSFYCNKYFKTHYDVNQMLEAIQSNILVLYGQSNWGYSLKFFLAAVNRVHPNYVSDYISKGTLSISDLNKALSEIDDGKKLLYNKDESIRVFQKINDEIENETQIDLGELQAALLNRNVLMVGPGDTVIGEKNKIDEYIREKSPLVVMINCINKNIHADYVFVTNSRRLCHISNHWDSIQRAGMKVIATSNLVSIFNRFDYTIDYKKLIDESLAKDSAMIMLLRLLVLVGVKEVALAGLDGYKSSFEEDFVDISNTRGWREPFPGFLNSYIRNEIRKYRSKLNVSFVTTSLFDEEDWF